MKIKKILVGLIILKVVTCSTMSFAESKPWNQIPLDEIVNRANAGEAEAQAEAAYRYYDGYGGAKKDVRKAYEFYLKGANNGQEICQFNLGLMYRDGEFVTKNTQVSKEWFEKAAQKKHPSSMIALANIESEAGNKEKEEEWYKKTAEITPKGNKRSFQMKQLSANKLYKNGLDKKENVKAFVWLSMFLNNISAVSDMAGVNNETVKVYFDLKEKLSSDEIKRVRKDLLDEMYKADTSYFIREDYKKKMDHGFIFLKGSELIGFMGEFIALNGKDLDAAGVLKDKKDENSVINYGLASINLAETYKHYLHVFPYSLSYKDAYKDASLSFDKFYDEKKLGNIKSFVKVKLDIASLIHEELNERYEKDFNIK